MATPEEQTATMIANLPEKTGKSLDEWLPLVKASGAAKHGEIVKFLKGDHGVGHGYANLIAATYLAGGAAPTGGAAPAGGAKDVAMGLVSGGDDMVDAAFAGPKAALRPIYDQLVGEVQKFGGDVELAPKKGYVSLRRKKQFGLLQPSTATRLDVGLNLKGVPPEGRLEASGSFNSMVSHRVRVASAADADAQLVGWLRQAYDQA